MLHDVRVRQALAMAIDRTAIARALLGPLGVEPEPLNNHIFMANQEGYQDNSGEVGTYDPEQGRPSCSTRPAGSSRVARAARTASPLEIKCVIPAGVRERSPGDGADPEHAGPDRRQDEHR